jgi:hypothetical protein
MIYIWQGQECSAAEMRAYIESMIISKGYYSLAEFAQAWSEHGASQEKCNALARMSDEQADIWLDAASRDAWLAQCDAACKRANAGWNAPAYSQKIFREIIEHDLLEDRREYGIDDLILAYGLAEKEALALHAMIQQEFK